jgi:hypothetical protein
MSDYFGSQIRMLARYLQEHWQDEIKEEETAAELAIRLLSESCPTEKKTMRDLSLDDASINTDVELFREKLGDKLDPDNYYSPSVHVTQSQCIGMNVGGYVIVMSIRAWHEAAQQCVHPTGLTAAQKEEVRQMIQSALDTGST